MIIKIVTNDTLDPNESTVEVNGNVYKDFDNLKLILAKDTNGSLVIQHVSGFLEAYKGTKKKEDI